MFCNFWDQNQNFMMTAISINILLLALSLLVWSELNLSFSKLSHFKQAFNKLPTVKCCENVLHKDVDIKKKPGLQIK